MKGTYNIRCDEKDLFSPGQALDRYHYKTWRDGYLKRWRKPWSTFVKLCRSLHDSGLHYKVLIIEEDGRYSLQVNAWGSPSIKRKKRKPQGLATIKVKVPAALTAKRCRREQDQARETVRILLHEMRSAVRLSNPYDYPRSKYEFTARDNIRHEIDQNHKLGKWFACRISTKGRSVLSYSVTRSDYEELDYICKSPVTRISELTLNVQRDLKAHALHLDRGTIEAYFLAIVANSHWFGRKTRWEVNCERCEIKPIDLIGYNKAKAEIEHWTEMLRLIKER